jgi:hypothetical protein
MRSPKRLSSAFDVEDGMEAMDGKSDEGGGFEGGEDRSAQAREVWKSGGV